MARVRIGTCSGPVEAALVRSALEAHAIPVAINAEQHASMLGGLGGALVPLHVFVPEEHAEEAAALLRDLREQHESVGADDDDDDGDDPGASGVEVRVDHRRRTGVVLLLAMCITFGTAHMYTGAWLRGLGLLGLEILAFRFLMTDPRVGSGLLVACIATDLIGALLRIRATRARLPEARIRR